MFKEGRQMISRGLLGIGLASALALSGCVMHGNPSEPLVADEPGSRMAGTATRVEGSVVRVDAPQQVIVLDDGRMYQVVGANSVYVNGQPVVLTAVQPGNRVLINQPTVVEYRDGRYVAVAPVTAGVPATGVRQTIYGRITDVDRDGDVRVRTDKGSFEM